MNCVEVGNIWSMFRNSATRRVHYALCLVFNFELAHKKLVMFLSVCQILSHSSFDYDSPTKSILDFYIFNLYRILKYFTTKKAHLK